jgi:hypothetical protein
MTLRQPSKLAVMSIPPATDQVQGPAIHVQGLEKSYKELRVLRGVDLDVARGSIFALLGSNGAGKTTVVKILSTLLKADTGTARVNGFDVATQAADVRESISLTGQFAAVDEILSGRENLVNRVVAMVHRYREGRLTGGEAPAPGGEDLEEACRRAPGLIDVALADLDFRTATSAVWAIVDAANRYVDHIRPWELAKAGDDRLDAVLGALVRACRAIAEHLAPFLPDAASRVTRQCALSGGRLPDPTPAFAKVAP